MRALTVTVAFLVLSTTCKGSPVPESSPSSSTTENEIGPSNEIGGEVSEKPSVLHRPGLRATMQPVMKANHREVIPTGTAVRQTTTHFTTSENPEHTTHKTTNSEHTTHKTAHAAIHRPTQNFKVKSHKNCSGKKKDHVVRIHVGTGQVVFFSGACGPKTCVVKKELINGAIEPGTQL